jgi:hypothetical protein
MRSPLTPRRLSFLGLVLVLLGWVGVLVWRELRSPDGGASHLAANPLAGGDPGPSPASGLPEPETTAYAPEPAGTITSPAGRVWRFGETDELGYVLPLDIRRPRPERSLGPPPARAEILARRSESAASLFEEHRVSFDDGHTQNETAIATDVNTVLAAFHTYTDPALLLAIARSLDGGHTWLTSAVSGFHTNLTDPSIQAAGSGRWHLSYIAAGGVGGSDLDVFVRTSTDAGATFGAPVAVTNDANFDDKPYMAARGNDVLVAYADFGVSPAKVHAVRSTDGGASFDHDTILANNSVGGNGACPVIDSSGRYYVFWRDSFQDSLWVSKSTDGGVTWSADRGIAEMFPLPSQLPGGFRIINLPSAAADPLTGALVVVWNDQRFGGPDIAATRSTDGGTTWSTPVRVNDDAGATAQFFPWITFDPHGNAHVAWYDRREDGFKIDVYHARSVDLGQSFEANSRVTAQAFTPVLPWDTSVAFIGDYNAIAANATTVFPCYQDAREGNQDVYVALVPGGPATGLASAPAPAAEVVLTAAPRLFSGSVHLRAAARPGATVEIASPLGRRVRRITLGGDGSAVWDGRADGGERVARGLYFARLADGGGALKLVKLD